jgi:hypothetical protein
MQPSGRVDIILASDSSPILPSVDEEDEEEYKRNEQLEKALMP